ncbi:MAG: NAD(P)-dependent oxidoreductase [Bacteroidia bacterium]|nr:NAD(P)-dependent oxidoreductase [Bacteroidia bacterium]
MKVTVTGGTGFIGNHVVQELLLRGAEVWVTGTLPEKAAAFSWFEKVHFHTLNFTEEIPGQNTAFIESVADSDALIHLAWSGLPNYKSLFHFEENLMPQYFFLKKIVEAGLRNITVTGTCFEYGMKNGPLSPDMPADPQNPYALAKDTLRKFLQQLQQQTAFDLKWVRLFYMYGEGQSEKSILAQLEKAIRQGEKVFNMSGGEQLRDYLPVKSVAAMIVDKALEKNANGIFNCCSGVPISIRSLVENYLKETNNNISLNLGYYPYPDYEPMAFWGVKS